MGEKRTSRGLSRQASRWALEQAQNIPVGNSRIGWQGDGTSRRLGNPQPGLAQGWYDKLRADQESSNHRTKTPASDIKNTHTWHQEGGDKGPYLGTVQLARGLASQSMQPFHLLLPHNLRPTKFFAEPLELRNPRTSRDERDGGIGVHLRVEWVRGGGRGDGSGRG